MKVADDSVYCDFQLNIFEKVFEIKQNMTDLNITFKECESYLACCIIFYISCCIIFYSSVKPAVDF